MRYLSVLYLCTLTLLLCTHSTKGMSTGCYSFYSLLLVIMCQFPEVCFSLSPSKFVLFITRLLFNHIRCNSMQACSAHFTTKSVEKDYHNGPFRCFVNLPSGQPCLCFCNFIHYFSFLLYTLNGSMFIYY